MIVISCVRAGTPSIGFLQEKERLNVALTRARFCLVVIGHMDTLEKASPDLWGELVTDANQHVKSALASVIMGLSPILGTVGI